ncbi:MAG TPA: zinc-dependent metalloprotease [Chitinophagaceae bacterium]|nr:zinc-dependent metalloprotease [Chitinophagaceae bacterium]
MTRIILIILLFGFFNAASAQVKKPIRLLSDEKPKADSVKSTPKTISDFVTAKAISKKGMFSIHQVGEKYYFEIPDSLLGRELLLTTWLVKVPGGSPKFGGEVMNNRTISFTRWNGGSKIALNVTATINQVDTTNVISTAVKNSNVNSVAILFDIKARSNDGTSLIDATDFLQKENSFTMLNAEVKNRMSVSSMAADRSWVKSFAAYPINVEIKMMRTYGASTAPAALGRPPVAPIEAARLSGAITMEISTSIMLMPEKPMTPRRFDARVGYFADAYQEYADAQQKVNTKIFIVRYRLEPKPEDLQRYKRGELVEPKEPIVYYVDPATPKQWRPYIIAGINDWNEAFKAAGFKNAIIGKEWPENDTTMSLEDARYKVIRYFPSEVANAYGPNIHDPRSGEVLQSYVGWYHNVMSLLHDWYMVQAAPNDPRARTMKFSDELMGTLIRFVSSHEVGHTLGLRHNMGSSSLTPVEKLRDKKWVEEHGHTNSIMDYARFNYVAQPEDSIGENGIMPRINDYDKWAIKWGYTYTGITDDEEDRKVVTKWIVDSLKANPRLWFGGEGFNHDARCQSEDVGDNSMKASEYGIKNLKYVMAHLPGWTKEDNDLYTNLTNMYRQVATQYMRYCLHVTANVASVYETWKTVEQPGDVYVSSPKEKQKEAVAFLTKEVFTTPEWLLDNEILNKISNPVRLGSLPTIQARVLDQLLSDRVFNTLLMMENRYGKSNTYSIIEFIDDVKAGVWTELKNKKPVTIYRRSLQKNYVANILASIKEAEEGSHIMGLLVGGPTAAEELPMTTGSDVGSFLALHLEKLRAEILAVIHSTTDKDTKDHLNYIAEQIKNGLANQFKK